MSAIRYELRMIVTLRIRTSVLLLFSAVANLASFATPDLGMAQVSLSVAPLKADVSINQTQQFNATVSGTKDKRVTWSVTSEGAGRFGPGLIDSDGLYTAPPNALTPPFVLIRATSIADPTASATVTVIVRDLLNSTHFNSNDDLDASPYNDGAFITFGWTGLPFGTARIVFSRAPTIKGAWTQVLFSEFAHDLTSSGSADYTDLEAIPPDTTKDYFYKMEAFSATNLLLKSYTPLFLPKFERAP
jgi:hypothetical protein